MSKPSTHWVASPALATAGSGRPASSHHDRQHLAPAFLRRLGVPNWPSLRSTLLAFLWVVWFVFPAAAQAARLKELASVQGVRGNPLVGYGLVVGLDGTGDQTTSAPFTAQSLNSMLQQMGVSVPPGTVMQIKNVAAVMVTA